jgi:hypothetical protein
MNEPTLAERLDRLEWENRRLKLAGAVIMIAIAAVLADPAACG